MKVKEILSILHRDGWYLIAQKGSHKQFKHLIKPGRITVRDHGMNIDLAKYTAFLNRLA
jgi:predicted RNA binding protein YcfA (HicA-like mRNA interferase family)